MHYAHYAYYMSETPIPIPAREARRHMARLRNLAGRLDRQAALVRNGGRDSRAEERAGKLNDESFAIRWALRHLAPAFEEP
jgi:hypothetical protein